MVENKEIKELVDIFNNWSILNCGETLQEEKVKQLMKAIHSAGYRKLMTNKKRKKKAVEIVKDIRRILRTFKHFGILCQAVHILYYMRTHQEEL